MIYIYGRCQAQEAYEKGSSIETQILKCKSYAITKDLIVDKVITEQVSGTIAFDKRVQGGEILNNLKSGDHIICSALDRLSRNHMDLLNLVEFCRKNQITNYLKNYSNVWLLKITFLKMECLIQYVK